MTSLGKELQDELDLLNALRPMFNTVDAGEAFDRVWSGQRARVQALLERYANQERF
jgi:hypothetical protein